MLNKRIYRNPRPLLTVEIAGGVALGNCYYGTTYRITSLRPLNLEQLAALRRTGMIGYGQEHDFWYVGADGQRTRAEGVTSAPSGVDVVQCSEVDPSGEVVRCPSINPYTGVEDKPTSASFYVYECVDKVDSSD